MDLSKGSNPDPQQLGIEIARAYDWDGVEIFRAALAALEDANFHRVSRELIDAWERIEGKL